MDDRKFDGSDIFGAWGVGFMCGVAFVAIIMALTSCTPNPGGGGESRDGGKAEIIPTTTQPAPWLCYSGTGTMWGNFSIDAFGDRAPIRDSVYLRYPHTAPWAKPADSTSVLVLNAHSWSAYRLSFRGNERRISYGSTYVNPPKDGE